MKPLPSRLRIALLSAGISGVVLAAFGGVMWVLIYNMRMEAVDREIRTLGSRHPGLFAGRGNYERLASTFEFTFGEDFTNHVILLLRDATGRTSYASPHWPEALDPGKLDLRLEDNPPSSASSFTKPNLAASPTRTESNGSGRSGMGRGFGMGRGGPPQDVAFTKPPKFFTAKTTASAWRFGVLGNDDVTLVIGLNQQEVEHELNQVRVAFLLTLPVALFLVGLGGWVVAGRALRPLKAIADTAERVTARGLDQRIPESGESPEASRVIQVLNRMIDRLEASFRQATRFSADASHELKTPLTVMQGELENALQAATPGSAEQQLFSNLLEEIQRLKNITRSLLLLAQADAGQLKLAVETVNLSAEMESMIEDARVLATDSRQQFDVKFEPQVWVEADRALLHTALFNLIHNAIKYNTPDGKISIRLNTAGDKTVFTIGNSGPGIPAADQPGIFERFYRVGRVNTPKVEGLGLGLSLAREIVRAHGGELSLKESRVDWTSFEVLLPRASRNG
ncbi:MAG: ATP-binding protein [Verrucomicrobiota bacterium]